MPYVAYASNSVVVPTSTLNFLDNVTIPSSNNDNEDENPPLPTHVPLIAPEPILPQWVCSTCEASGDLVDDPRDQRRTCS